MFSHLPSSKSHFCSLLSQNTFPIIGYFIRQIMGILVLVHLSPGQSMPLLILSGTPLKWTVLAFSRLEWSAEHKIAFINFEGFFSNSKHSDGFRFIWTRVILFRREQRNYQNYYFWCWDKNMTFWTSYFIFVILSEFWPQLVFSFHCWWVKGPNRLSLTFLLWQFLFLWSENLPAVEVLEKKGHEGEIITRKICHKLQVWIECLFV